VRGRHQLRKASRARTAKCAHIRSVSVTSAGVTRHVCEDCGHVGFNFEKSLDGLVERDRFSRPADETSETLVGTSERH
jgi:hypothetical protein